MVKCIYNEFLGSLYYIKRLFLMCVFWMVMGNNLKEKCNGKDFILLDRLIEKFGNFISGYDLNIDVF